MSSELMDVFSKKNDSPLKTKSQMSQVPSRSNFESMVVEMVPLKGGR